MMEAKIGNSRIVLLLGDITNQEVDAIVNAANPSLLGGGGVDGAIHRAGGPEILAQTRKLGGCDPGDAKVTSGGRLKARYLIHAVGPIWYGGGRGEDQTLESAYRRSLELAAKNKCRTVAFPSISTGAYGFPLDRAAKIAIQTIAQYLRGRSEFEEIRMVLFTQHDFDVYSRELRGLGN